MTQQKTKTARERAEEIADAHYFKSQCGSHAIAYRDGIEAFATAIEETEQRVIAEMEETFDGLREIADILSEELSILKSEQRSEPKPHTTKEQFAEWIRSFEVTPLAPTIDEIYEYFQKHAAPIGISLSDEEIVKGKRTSFWNYSLAYLDGYKAALGQHSEGE